jgi:hypothetical protein
MEGGVSRVPSKGRATGRGIDFERSARPWRLVFGTSLIAGVVHIALIRELSAYHSLLTWTS